MFLYIATILLTTIFTPESLVSSIIGAGASYGLTQFLKKKTRLQGAGAALLAFGTALLVATIAYVGSVYLNGGELSLQMIPQNAAQIFTLATLSYKLMSERKKKSAF
jgi:hypothetical protein